jgi:hypothetical protein
VLRSPGRAALSGAGLLVLGLPLCVNNEAEFWPQTHAVTGKLLAAMLAFPTRGTRMRTAAPDPDKGCF